MSTLPLSGVVPLQSGYWAQTQNVPPGDERVDKNRPWSAIHAKHGPEAPILQHLGVRRQGP